MIVHGEVNHSTANLTLFAVHISEYFTSIRNPYNMGVAGVPLRWSRFFNGY